MQKIEYERIRVMPATPAPSAQNYVQSFIQTCDDVYGLLSEHDDAVFDRVTGFKNWTVNDIIAHLHVWNIAADLTIQSPEAFQDFLTQARPLLANEESHQAFQTRQLDGLSGRPLFERWHQDYQDMGRRLSGIDPGKRVAWAGPDMSVEACIIARQMEHWAHAQAIYDVLGQTRQNQDTLYPIAHLGVLTYSWSFRVRGMEPPMPKPYVRLVAPSGAIWTWNDEQAHNRIDGAAVDFCQTVTQCRNVRDTNLRLTGDIAHQWMDNAQCFAGPPETPPAPGTRARSQV